MSTFSPDDGDSEHFCNLGKLLQEYPARQFIRPPFHTGSHKSVEALC